MLKSTSVRRKSSVGSMAAAPTAAHGRPMLSENELAARWGLSPKTLQRWRSEGRGPNYLKLSKRVTYPLEEVDDFELRALHVSTSERVMK